MLLASFRTSVCVAPTFRRAMVANVWLAKSLPPIDRNLWRGVIRQKFHFARRFRSEDESERDKIRYDRETLRAALSAKILLQLLRCSGGA